MQQNKKSTNLAFSPVLEQPENPEFFRRKQELEEELQNYSKQLKKEYADKVIFI